MVGVKPGDSDVMIGCQVDEFTCTWSAYSLNVRSHIYPGLTGKVSTLTHFTLEPVCDDYSFLEQAVKDFEYGLNSILMDAANMPKLEESFDEANAMLSSVFSRLLCLVSTYSHNSRLQLASSIKCHTLWCHIRALLLPYHRQVKSQPLS